MLPLESWLRGFLCANGHNASNVHLSRWVGDQREVAECMARCSQHEWGMDKYRQPIGISGPLPLVWSLAGARDGWTLGLKELVV